MSSQFFYNSILQIFYEIIFTIFFWKTSFHQINISNNFKSIKNCFTLTDEDVSKLDQFSEFNLTGAHSQSNLSIFHKFFLSSIFNVKKEESRFILLKFFRKQLEFEVDHISLNDIDDLYQCVFIKLPNFEGFRTNTNLMDLLLLIMNLFIMRFYYFAFPFFYNTKIEDNLFSHNDPFFIVKYFLKFGYFLKTNHTRNKLKSNFSEYQTKYLDLLKNDGSLINIMDYLFDLYSNGFDFENVSNCIYQIIEFIDYRFTYEYLQRKKIYGDFTAIFFNEKNNSLVRMNFPIAFFINFFHTNYSEVQYTKQFFYFGKKDSQNIEKKKDISQNIIQKISEFKIQNYLESFLGSYIDQLIREGRLLNTKNPFPTPQPTEGSFTVKYFPERTNDDDIMNMFNLFFLIFKTINEAQYPTCIIDFIPIITAAYKIIPGIFFDDYKNWTLSLFEYLQTMQLPQLDAFKNCLLESVYNRLVGNYRLSENIQKSTFYSILPLQTNKIQNLQHLLQKVNRYSISLFIQRFYSINHSHFFSPIEFLQLTHLPNVQSINELIKVMIKVMKKDSKQKKIAFSTFLYYLNFSTDPILIKSYLKLFFILELNNDDYQKFNHCEFIINYINLFLNEPKVINIITHQQIFKFCQLTGKYVIDNVQFIENCFKKVFESGDLFQLKIISIIINFGTEYYYQRFTEQIANFIKIQTDHFAQGTPDNEIIRTIISLSPYLISFDFRDNDNIFNLIKNCIAYLNTINQNQNKQELMTLDDFHDKNESCLKFDDMIDQIKANLTFSLTNSFGFCAQQEISQILPYFLNKYGMCIEVLYFLANIIGYLVPFINIQNFPDQLNEINDIIFKIMQILIENDQMEIKTNVHEDDRSNYNNDFDSCIKRMKNQEKINPNQEIHHYFALSPIGYEFKISQSSSSYYDQRYKNRTTQDNVSIIKDCFYSYKMRGTKVNDHFVNSIEEPYLYRKIKSEICDRAKYTVNLFIRNISEYSISLLNRYGIKPKTINLYKQIILFAFKNGLIRVEFIDVLFQFIISEDGFLIDEREVKFWVEEAIARASILMISSLQSEKKSSEELEIGTAEEHLKKIYIFLYRTNRIYFGCVSDQLISVMFQNNNFCNYSFEKFMNFINSGEDNMDENLRLIFD